MKISYSHIQNEIKGLIKAHPKLPLILGVSVSLTVVIGTILYFNRKNRIVRYAKSFVGEEEIAGNMGFADKEFQQMIHEYGDFNPGQQWCASFVKMIWLKKFGEKYRDDLDRLLTPSTIVTWDNFSGDTSGKFKTSQEPSKGAIVIWRQYADGSPTSGGHTGIVQDYNDQTFDTIEGNSNIDSSPGKVAQLTRKYNFDLDNGLRLVGFISINK
jgi:hypothetical protein